MSTHSMNTKSIVVATFTVSVGVVVYQTLNKLYNIGHNTVTLSIKSDEPSNISIQQLYQLVSRKLSDLAINVESITYLGHGEDFDSFCIDIDNGNESYMIRIARDNKYELIGKLKEEIKLLSLLNPYFIQNDININIPNYNDGNPICSLLTNTNNPNKSYIYGTYSMINGKQLWQCKDHKINKLLVQNADKIANFLAILHQFDASNLNKEELLNHAGDELLWMIEEIEENYMNIPIEDKEFAEFVQSEIIDKCNNILIPKIIEYEETHVDKTNNKFIYGLVHADLHGDHILFMDEDDSDSDSDGDNDSSSSDDDDDDDDSSSSDSDSESNSSANDSNSSDSSSTDTDDDSNDNDTHDLCGIIDWSDIRISYIAFEFRYLWEINIERALDIISKYKHIRKLDKDKIELFDLCVNIYGFIERISSIFWHLERNIDDKRYLNSWKKYKKHWNVWTAKVIEILS